MDSVPRSFRSSRMIIRLFSASVLLLAVLAGQASAQTEEGKSSPASGIEVVTAGTTGERKSGYEKGRPRLGGPTSVPSQLEEDDLVKKPAVRFPSIDKALQPWFDWKKEINEKYNLQIGLDYVSLYQGASDSLTGEDNAASGIFRLFGRWNLLGRGTQNPGSLVFKVEHRHRIGTDITPAELSTNIGYLGQTGPLFTDVGLILNDLNWRQAFNNGQSGVIVGRYDPNDFIDAMIYASPWTGFQNLAFLINTTIAIPDASYGVGASTFIKDQWFVQGTVNDANGTIENLEFFEDGSEFFSTAEVGWTLSKENRYSKSFHVTYWHVDERKTKAIPESDGVTLGAIWLFGNEWLPFARVGWSDGLASLMQKTITVGIAHLFNSRSDVIGLGVNWGDPGDNILREQYTTELFYKYQLSQNLAITPSLQWLVHPALNPNEDEIWIFGLRMRMSL